MLEWVADGRSLLSWCDLVGCVARGTVYNWERKDPEFAEQLARAREAGNAVLEDEQIAIADQRPADMTDVAWHKLQIETRQKVLANRNPAKYGQKAQLAIGGNPDAPPIQLSVHQRADRVAALVKLATARRITIEDPSVDAMVDELT